MIDANPAPSRRAGPPLVVLGLDAFEVEWLHRWIREGRLPFLASLMARGTFAPVVSSAFADAPWPSMFSGTTPGQHAFHTHLCLRRGTYRIERTDARWCRQPPFWSRLRGTGLRAAVVDVPKTFPIDGIEGVQVCGWGEHYPLLRRPESHPPGLIADLVRRFGAYPHIDETTVPPSRRWERRTLRAFLENVERRTRAVEHLLDAGAWDLFFAVFSEIHYAEHQFIHLADETHWAFDPAAPQELRAAFPDVTSRVDAALERICRRLPAGANLVVLSVHGMKPNYSGNFLVETFLQRLGVMTPAPPTPPDGAVGALLYRTRQLRSLIPPPVRGFINRRLLSPGVHDRAMADAFAAAADWPRTQAFMLPSDHFQAFISLNLKGREPQGTVEPGAEARVLARRLRAEFLRLVNFDTGRPAVASAEWVPDHHPGAHTRDLPDLVVHWSHDAPIERVEHPELGRFEGPPQPLRKSQHTARGFLVGAGPAFASGAHVDELDTVEIAPTLLRLLGLPADPGMDAGPRLDLIARASDQGGELALTSASAAP